MIAGATQTAVGADPGTADVWHSADGASWTFESVSFPPRARHALEVFNAATTLKRYNTRAFNYAQKRGLPMTAASDAHHESAIGTAYTILRTKDFSVRGILDQIRVGTELNQRYQSPKQALKKTWNLLRLRRRKRHKPES